MASNTNWQTILIGRKMWYEPWPFYYLGGYREPTKVEKKEIFCKSGEAFKETLLYFEECGGNTNELIKLLNEHVIDERFIITRSELIDETRWYSGEYYFYFIMFTKKIIGRFDFHFGENSNERLCISHNIYEKGFIEKTPWGINENGKLIRDNSSEEVYNIYSYIINKNEYGEKIIHEIIDFLNFFLIKHKNKDFDKSLFLDQNYWFTNELMCYFYSILQIITNNNNILYEANLILSSPLLVALGRLTGSIKNVYKNVPDLAQKFNNLIEYKITRLTNNTCTIRYYYKVNIIVQKYMLSIHQQEEMSHTAIFKAIPTAFNNSATAKHKIKKSYVRDDNYFEGDFIWKNKANSNNIIQIILNVFIIIGILFFNPTQGKFVKVLLAVILLILNILYFSIKKNFDFLNFYKVLSEDFEKIDKSKDELTERLLNEKDMLEHRVHERTLELEEKNEKLKELDNAKTNFFENISHELRTPLTLILGPLKSIIQGDYGKRIDNANNIFKTIQNNALRLLKLINNLLDITKITAGKMNVIKEKIDLVKLIKVFITNVKDSCANKNIELVFESELDKLIVMLDTSLFETVLFNLFSNAFKFTPEGGKISIALNKYNDFFELSVSDTGIGIPEDMLDIIFERFGRIDKSINKKTEGTGIGLALTKQIVELHDGQITVESKYGKGSTFKIKIPIIDDNDTEKIRKNFIFKDELLNEFKTKESIKINMDFNKNKKNLFIVEDNKDMLEYLISSTNQYYNNYYAVNGKDALKELKYIPKPDLIISDIMMEEMDGYEFLNKLYKKNEYNNIPFIFLTAKTTLDEKIKGLSMGAIDYISKPFDMNELLVKIDSIIKNREINKTIISEKIKKKILKEIKKNVDENIAVNFEENCRIYNITEREKEIIKLLIGGKMYKEICWELNISKGTVGTHIKNIYKKCNVQTKIDLINALKKEPA